MHGVDRLGDGWSLFWMPSSFPFFALFTCYKLFHCAPGFLDTTSSAISQFSSVTQSCPTLCNPTNHSTPGLPVHHQLLEFTQTHIHRVGDAIQPSHPLLSPSLPAPNPSQHQGLFQWVNSSMRWPKYWSRTLCNLAFQDLKMVMYQVDTVPSHQTEKDFEAMHRAKGFMQAVLPEGLMGILTD